METKGLGRQNRGPRTTPTQGGNRLARPGVTFLKRKKERDRREKRQAKAERREERKAQKAQNEESGPPIEILDPADVGLPELENLRAEKHRLPDAMRERIEAGTV